MQIGTDMRADVRPEIVWSRPVGLPVSFLFSLASSSLIGLMLIFAKLRYWFIKIRVCGSISKKFRYLFDLAGLYMAHITNRNSHP